MNDVSIAVIMAGNTIIAFCTFLAVYTIATKRNPLVIANLGSPIQVSKGIVSEYGNTFWVFGDGKWGQLLLPKGVSLPPGQAIYITMKGDQIIGVQEKS